MLTGKEKRGPGVRGKKKAKEAPFRSFFLRFATRKEKTADEVKQMVNKSIWGGIQKALDESFRGRSETQPSMQERGKKYAQ